ncbi:hypothetical protein [Marinomonas balearica]|uniref:DUF1800 domain-containing protein n=1 Tax=Marinomonas balearica TaxID=491947 RepID=A0A4R6MEC8_9GAMM|nr:hypothetical protein [Marinomonas balearica]TDO99595.1 hypothetical protein DFP79_0580 [Marinomonas balearica]
MDIKKRALITGAAVALQACGDSDSEENSSNPDSPAGNSSTPNSNQMLSRQGAVALYLPNNEALFDYSAALAHFSTRDSAFYYDLEPYLERYERTDNPIIYLMIHLGHGNPLSKEFFDNWITYQLSNTFVLAVGSELATVSDSLVISHLHDIREAVANDTSIKDYVYEYFLSEMFWARFRSPEDNGREVLEIYLGLFQDDLVPKAAQILKNYSFNESTGSLEKSLEVNTEAQEILGELLTTPGELYQFVVNHDDFLPHIYTHIVKQLYGYEDREVIGQLQQINATTFREVYLAALFHENMASVTRPKFPEEVLFPALKSGNYQVRRNDFTVFLNLMDQIGTRPMLSKLERSRATWNALNIGNISSLLERVYTNEAGSFSSHWNYGYSQSVYLALARNVDNSSTLLQNAHRILWREDHTYPTQFEELVTQQATDRDKINTALRIAAMNYALYAHGVIS